MFSPFDDRELAVAMRVRDTSSRVHKHLLELLEELTISKDRFQGFGVEFASDLPLSGITPVGSFTSRLTYVVVDEVVVGRVVFEMPIGETKKPFFSLLIYRDGRLKNGDDGDQYWQLDGYDDSRVLDRFVTSLTLGQIRVHTAELST